MKTALLSMRITEAESYTERRNSIAYEYVDLLERLNFLVVLVPMNSKNIDIYFKLNKIDLVVLSGGNNVDPKLYDSPETLSDVYPERDKVEAELIDIAIDNKIKVLGICRGFHFINIFFGGGLSHHIVNHVNKKHLLTSSNKTLNNQVTNSYHNHGIDRFNLSSYLKELACSADDGYIEAAIDEKKNILGLQWHPERRLNKFDTQLILDFIEGRL